MIFVDARCPVQSCPHNHGGDGCSCGFAGYNVACAHPLQFLSILTMSILTSFAGYNVACAHPRHKVEWWDRTGGIVPSVDGGDGAQSLTARAAEAQRATVELTAAEAAQRALQLALELGACDG